MKILFILNDPPYGAERVYNSLRLANALIKADPATAVTLIVAGRRIPWWKQHGGNTAQKHQKNQFYKVSERIEYPLPFLLPVPLSAPESGKQRIKESERRQHNAKSANGKPSVSIPLASAVLCANTPSPSSCSATASIRGCSQACQSDPQHGGRRVDGKGQLTLSLPGG